MAINMHTIHPGPLSARPPGVESTSLLDVLANNLVSALIVPYLPVASVLAIASTNHTYRGLITQQPHLSSAFQYLNLSTVRCAAINGARIDVGGQAFRSGRMDEAFTEDDAYSGPLRGIFNRMEKRNWLECVATLVLDGLCVPTEIVQEIIMDDRFNVRILSIRDVQLLNIRKLCQTLKYVARPSRPKSTPKLRGLYVFGPKDPQPVKEEDHGLRRRSPTRFPDTRPSETVRAIGAALGEEWNKRSQETLAKELGDTDDKWYHSAGKLIMRTPHSEWAETIMACEGIIHFDAVLCRGPRHTPPTSLDVDTSSYLPPAVATVALGPDGCDGCNSCPEGPAIFGQSPSYEIPLLAPPPFTSFSIRAAQMPSSAFLGEQPRIIARCTECLRGRWCERCHKWWCEPCYNPTALTTSQQTPNTQHFDRAEEFHPDGSSKPELVIKVHMGFCTESCLLKNMSDYG
jgi:hypothetical protein